MRTIDVNFHTPEVIADPYPLFAELRALGPVLWHTDGYFVLTSYEAVRDVLIRAEDFSSRDANRWMWTGPEYHEAHEIMKDAAPRVPALLTTDPPVHTRHRGIVRQAFGVRRVAKLEDFITKTSIELAATLPRDRPAEIFENFASILPLQMITDAVGAGQEDLRRVGRWSDAVIAQIGKAVTPDEAVEYARTRVELQHYLIERIEAARVDPSDDLLGDIVRADQSDDGELSTPEMIGILEQLLIAGNETSARLITFMMQELASDPELQARVRADRHLVDPLMEELLRLETPVQVKFRTATSDLIVAGEEIGQGVQVMVLFGCANRDDAHFPEPDQLDLTRENARTHLAFGFGPHLCVGAQLARSEARIAVNTLLDTFDSITMSTAHDDPKVGLSFVHRGLESLHLNLS